MRRPRCASGLVLFSALCVPFGAGAQSTTPQNPAVNAQPDYHPSMGDLMTTAIQPRHIKLQLAGSQQNWVYASYELSELRHAFDRIARTILRYQTIDTASMATAVTQAPLDTLEQAIKARSPTQFAVAYAQLTQACNACHQSLNHAAIVIKVPDSTMFPDQDFRPPASADR